MDTKNIERYLDSFGKQVVNRAKSNLGKEKGGNTKLEKSIKFKVVQTGTLSAPSFDVRFYMYDYGAFLDEGVSGTKKKQTFKNYKGATQSSPYKFGSGSSPVGKSKGGMSGIMTKWIKRKGFQWKDKETGRFMSHKSMGYLVARSKYRDGIKSLSFFQKPFGLAWKNFDVLYGKALMQDIEESLQVNK